VSVQGSKGPGRTYSKRFESPLAAVWARGAKASRRHPVLACHSALASVPACGSSGPQIGVELIKATHLFCLDNL
jgi:hypothetical protein